MNMTPPPPPQLPQRKPSRAGAWSFWCGVGVFLTGLTCPVILKAVQISGGIDMPQPLLTAREAGGLAFYSCFGAGIPTVLSFISLITGAVAFFRRRRRGSATVGMLLSLAYLALTFGYPIAKHRGWFRGPAEPWMSENPEEWPQILLTHVVWQEYRKAMPDGAPSRLAYRYIEHASAFLLEGDQGGVCGVTASHLYQDIHDLAHGGEKGNWWLSPRAESLLTVTVTRKTEAWSHEGERRDMLYLRLEVEGGVLPSQPLHRRKTPVRPGERAFLIGCPYAEEQCKQNAYPAQVIGYKERHLMILALDRVIDLTGFSGAPVIDTRGKLIGVTTRDLGMLFPRAPVTIVGAVPCASVREPTPACLVKVGDYTRQNDE